MPGVGHNKSNLTSGCNLIRQKGVEMRVAMRVLTEECGWWATFGEFNVEFCGSMGQISSLEVWFV
jgi:hypothetical protein